MTDESKLQVSWSHFLQFRDKWRLCRFLKYPAVMPILNGEPAAGIAAMIHEFTIKRDINWFPFVQGVVESEPAQHGYILAARWRIYAALLN